MACWWCGGIIRNRSRPSFILAGQYTLHYTGGPTGRRGRRRGGGWEEEERRRRGEGEVKVDILEHYSYIQYILVITESEVMAM